MARTLINVPTTAKRGEVIEIRATIGHPMETGFRAGSEGQILARNLVRRVEGRFDGELFFAADLHPAISANPYLAFALRVTASGLLTVTWQGDGSFSHSESVRINAA